MTRTLLALALLVAACEPETEDRFRQEHNSKTALTVSYMRDERTGLCFAGKWVGMNGGIFASVPCSPEVLRLIKEGSAQ